MKVLIAALVYSLFFVLVEVVALKLKLSKEISRKTVHVIAGVSAAFLPFVMSFQQIVYLSLLFIPVMLYSRKANIFSSIHGVERKTLGEVYFPFAILITALLFPDKTLYVYGLLIMAVSDGFASIIGQRYGKHGYKILSSHKSYEGSLTFFLLAVGIGLIVMTASQISVLPALILSIVLGLVLALAEGSLSRGLDNLILPPLASGFLLILMKLFSLR